MSAGLEPADALECARELAAASADRRSVRIAGAGTKAYLGDVRPTDLELVTTRMSGVVDHVPADLTITVAGGTPFALVAAALARAGQFLPLDPPHADGATIGGVIAANSNGFWRARYGAIRDLLIGTRLALADGTTARAGGRVVKNVAGYDLDKLVVGSLGTLGVIVEATFKVLPIPAASSGLVTTFSRAQDAFGSADALVRGPSRQEAIVVERRSGGPWRLLVGARGNAATVARARADAAQAVADRAGGAEPADDVARQLIPLRELPATALEGALVRAALPLAAQRAFAETAADLDAFATCVADAASGIVRVHLRGDDMAVATGVDALLMAARAIGGSARVERRADALRERIGAWDPAEPRGHFLMRRLKEAFDPAGVLEPGRSAVG
jgi:glycolate oxidase FAD binding subunit